MKHLVKHLEALGISMADSRAAADYAKTQTQDELHYAAGEHLALHAVSITMALCLPKRGAAVLGVMKHVANSSWQRHWTIENDAFCLSALLDLCTVRSVFRQLRATRFDRGNPVTPISDVASQALHDKVKTPNRSRSRPGRKRSALQSNRYAYNKFSRPHDRGPAGTPSGCDR